MDNRNAEIKKRKPLCKFDLFVRLYPDLPSNFPYQQRVHTFRGDQHENLDTNDKMLIYLMNIVKKYWRSYCIIILRDNDYKKGDVNHTLFSLRKKTIMRNVLKSRYPSVFEDMVWPEWIVREKIGDDSAEDTPR